MYELEQYTAEQGLQEYKRLGLKLPEAYEGGRVQTLNKKGAAAPQFDEITKEFINFAQNKKVLEIGGAYGKVMIEVLKKAPNTIYHLNDLEKRHLFIAAYEAKAHQIPAAALSNLQLIAADITVPLKLDNEYEAILIALVLHFFSPAQIKTALENLFKMLRPGGKIYAVAITPYLKCYRGFIPEYESRVANNDPYPGHVPSLRVWVKEDEISSEQLAATPEEPFMFMDDKVMAKVFQAAGFNVLECKITALSYYSPTGSWDGRELVTLRAEKPV